MERTGMFHVKHPGKTCGEPVALARDGTTDSYLSKLFSVSIAMLECA